MTEKMTEKPTINKILYCTDLGKYTRPVFLHALALAEKNNATVTVLHVIEPMSDTARTVIETYMSKNDIEKIQKDGMEKIFNYTKKRIDAFLRQECGRSLEEEPIDEIKVVNGTPSEEILRIAEKRGTDMIVVGKSSNRVRGNRVMGSTTRQVNRLSKVPVLVIPNR